MRAGAGSPDEKPAPLLRSGIAGILPVKGGRFGAAKETVRRGHFPWDYGALA
jgi:hypothetical protein